MNFPSASQERRVKFSPRTTDVFCSPCPSVARVQEVLKAHKCFLRCTIPPSKQIATQYHFEAPYGVTVIFLAGYDKTHDVSGRFPRSHAARLWVSGNTHSQSLLIQRQITTELQTLTGGAIVEITSFERQVRCLQRGA